MLVSSKHSGFVLVNVKPSELLSDRKIAVWRALVGRSISISSDVYLRRIWFIVHLVIWRVGCFFLNTKNVLRYLAYGNLWHVISLSILYIIKTEKWIFSTNMTIIRNTSLCHNTGCWNYKPFSHPNPNLHQGGSLYNLIVANCWTVNERKWREMLELNSSKIPLTLHLPYIWWLCLCCHFIEFKSKFIKFVHFFIYEIRRPFLVSSQWLKYLFIALGVNHFLIKKKWKKKIFAFFYQFSSELWCKSKSSQLIPFPKYSVFKNVFPRYMPASTQF